MTRASSLAGAATRRRTLDGWQLCGTLPGQYAAPQDIDAAASAPWITAPLGTVASMLRSAGRWSLDVPPAVPLDAQDWWLRVSFELGEAELAQAGTLQLEGLAGLTDLWVNGQHALRSENMFVAHALRWRSLLRVGANTLHLRVASLEATLQETRRPRPRWRAPAVAQQQLRWFRQSLLGRMPGWTPPVPPLGPWRELRVESDEHAPRRHVDIRATLQADGAGAVDVSVAGDAWDRAPERITLELARDGQVHRAVLQRDAAPAGRWRGTLRIDRPALWWPHTHGEPALYDACLRIEPALSQSALPWPLRPVGFRRLELDDADGNFALRVNGVPVFCRGACWMPLDVVGLQPDAEAYSRALAQARDAGMNMLRVSGTTVYEQDVFFDACDAHGVLVWQDFMFANMDYPGDDASFVESVRVEVEQQMARWQGHPSLAVLCGNSEGEQQAAMWGAPRELWSPSLFHGVIRDCARARLPDVPYWPSSAHGGAFPHQGDQGTSSYYGVGAYLRPQDDARRANLRFATECLGFANVPEPATLLRLPQGASLRVHHPQWKARAPRDLGAGWDFEDVRDHYLAQLYGVDPMRCRYADHERYLALSRVVTGELMADAFAEWRRPGASCRGALVWFLRDLWAGAGWGLVDDQGLPKACWYILRRALQPTTLSISDEGGNGLQAHVVHEPAQALRAALELSLFGPADARVAQATHVLELPPRGGLSLPLAALFDGFFDLSYSYRFGPPAVTLVHAQLRSEEGRVLAQVFHFPAGRPALPALEMPLSSAELRRTGSGELSIHLEATRFAQFVQLELAGHTLSDNHFHMAPGSSREVIARAWAGEPAGALRGWARPLNSTQALPLRLAQ